MYWDWRRGGLLLGFVFLLAITLAKPIGVSTQYVIVDGIIAKQFNPSLITKKRFFSTEYVSENAYLNKSGGEYAKAVVNPLNYGMLFVAFMFVGGFLGKIFVGPKSTPSVPKAHQERFGEKAMLRYKLSFLGGIITLFGARLAGGCTSGNMMSGMVQTAISSYAFTLAAFVVAVPVTTLIYKRGRK